MNQFDAKWFAEYNAKRAKRLQEPLPYEKTPAKPKSKRSVTQRAGPSHLEVKFEQIWKILKGPPLEKEFKFHHTRMWRFDFAVLGNKVAIEVEGGQYGIGKPCPSCKQRRMVGHHTVSGFAEDAEKYNEAARAGWRVFRLTESMIRVDHLSPIIELCCKETKQLEDFGI